MVCWITIKWHYFFYKDRKFIMRGKLVISYAFSLSFNFSSICLPRLRRKVMRAWVENRPIPPFSFLLVLTCTNQENTQPLSNFLHFLPFSLFFSQPNISMHCVYIFKKSFHKKYFCILNGELSLNDRKYDFNWEKMVHYNQTSETEFINLRAIITFRL